ncbi:hypothetical protein KC317_g4700 [Hortaea werneckii]|nr:hypothetical protein KC352_g12498 [Hortaea werneckii]KAI7567851.1 hypothetical protein KC317_g4700 [Hortaea werneckii]
MATEYDVDSVAAWIRRSDLSQAQHEALREALEFQSVVSSQVLAGSDSCSDDTGIDLFDGATQERPKEHGKVVEDGHPYLPAPPAEDLVRWRERFLMLTEPVDLSPAQYQEIWPFVDNLWTYNNQYKKEGCSVVNFKCRFFQKSKPTQGHNRRRKPIAKGRECKVSMKLLIDQELNGDRLVPTRYRFVRKNTVPHHEECSAQNIDGFKRCSALLNAAGSERYKGAPTASVWRLLKAENNPSARSIFLAAGGLYMKKSDVRNAGSGHEQRFSGGSGLRGGESVDAGQGEEPRRKQARARRYKQAEEATRKGLDLESVNGDQCGQSASSFGRMAGGHLQEESTCSLAEPDRLVF